jgi:hypothetical protein
LNLSKTLEKFYKYPLKIRVKKIKKKKKGEKVDKGTLNVKV